ncbi:hypothetical protein [Psychrobacillus sp. FSL H8-0510]|uniref:hypothetical protein n=1 Tax=Psychrobacillus sp. FSL H8-0510 TaxID=2921394 RepID=UPI0030F888F6
MKNKWNAVGVFLFMCLLLLFVSPTVTHAQQEDIGLGGGADRIQYDDPKNVDEAWFNLYEDWQKFLAFVLAFGLLTSILIFIMLMMKLSNTGDNPYERQAVLKDILVLFVTTAILGGFGLFVTLVILNFYQ